MNVNDFSKLAAYEHNSQQAGLQCVDNESKECGLDEIMKLKLLTVGIG